MYFENENYYVVFEVSFNYLFNDFPVFQLFLIFYSLYL